MPTGQDGKPVLYVRDMQERIAISDALAPGFAYLEARITGTCEAPYSLATMYEACRMAQVFNPNFAKQHLNAALPVDSMAAIKPLLALDMLDNLKKELPLYKVAAAGSSF